MNIRLNQIFPLAPLFLGSEPPATTGKKAEEEGPHLKAVRVDVPGGKTTVLDLTAESLKQAE